MGSVPQSRCRFRTDFGSRGPEVSGQFTEPVVELLGDGGRGRQLLLYESPNLREGPLPTGFPAHRPPPRTPHLNERAKLRPDPLSPVEAVEPAPLSKTPRSIFLHVVSSRYEVASGPHPEPSFAAGKVTSELSLRGPSLTAPSTAPASWPSKASTILVDARRNDDCRSLHAREAGPRERLAGKGCQRLGVEPPCRRRRRRSFIDQAGR
jgi:hypothetical protein